MTTISDIMFDLVSDIQKDLVKLNEDSDIDIETISQGELQEKVEEYIEIIKNRIVG